MFFNFSSNIFYYRFLFMLELLSSEFLATYTLKKRNHYVIKLISGVVLSFLIVFVSPIIDDPTISSLIFLVYFLYTIFFLWFIYDESLISIIFCCLFAYATQHVCYEIYMFIVRMAHIGSVSPYLGDIKFNDLSFLTVFVYLCVYSLFYWFVWAIIYYQIRIREKLVLRNKSLLALGAILIIVDIFLNSYVVYSDTEVSEVIQIILFVYSLTSYVLIVFFQLFILRNKTLEDDLDKVSELWRQDQARFETNKKNFDLINIKCHDLKHQINNIKESGLSDTKALNELEKAVDFYDSSIKTGIEALDILLFQKSTEFQSNQIELIPLIDGKCLSFIKETDLYSIFDNALSNAIQSLKEEDIDKRLIKIKTSKKDNIVSIHFENYCSHQIEINKDDGLLLTTSKEDKPDHGYGMKSMKYLAIKYNGQMAFSLENNIFSLDFVFFKNNQQGE